MAHPVVHELTVDRNVAQVFAEIVTSLRQAGTPLPTNDIWIAATAAVAGATVLTYDHHYASIPRIGSVVLAREHGEA